MPFRICSNHFRVTWSQANNEAITKQVIFDKFKSDKNLKYICIAKEIHQDGGTHYHGHFYYEPRKDIKNEKYFDIQGIPHANIQKADNPKGWNIYVKEDNDYLEQGSLEDDDYDLYQSARNDDHDTFFETARSKKICFQYAMEAWKSANQVDTSINEQDEIHGTYNQLLDWYDTTIPNKSVVIVGPTGVGKTVFAKTKAPKPSLFCSHIDDLKSFRANYHKSIIFDDMSFKHIPTTGQIHLVDMYEPRSIHVRYGVVKIPRGVQRWITCNENPLSEHEAIRRRVNQINLY